MRTLAPILALVALLAGCTTPRYPVARVLFADVQGTATWVGRDALITVPHVAVDDEVRVFPRSARRWVSGVVTFRSPTWCLIRVDGGVRDGDSGSPVLDPHGLLIGLIDAGGQ